MYEVVQVYLAQVVEEEATKLVQVHPWAAQDKQVADG